MFRRFLQYLVPAVVLMLCTQTAAQAYPTTAVSYVSTRSSSTILAVNSPAAVYNPNKDVGPECSTRTYAVIYATWNVRQVTSSTVNLASVSLRLTNQRPLALTGGFIETGSGTITYRAGAGTEYPTGIHTLTYPINKTLSWNSYRQLRLRQNIEFGGYGSEPYYCNGDTFLAQWLQRR